ncbi:hypothetical protein ABZV80_41695 [Streptomyces sp. NPDC005132]|uniref:hypothetical protein n=1 Tax=Streptomyces sp. NPDC005132 TaxID=3154294 RepID=UPI0033B07CEE
MFGKDNSQQLQGISDQLTQALRELAALRQQVDNQQHAIDRGETVTRDHLNDTREVVRRALGENRELLINQLSAISSDLATVRANTQRYSSEPARKPAPEADQPADGEHQEDQHPRLLLAAAGISAAELRVHRDTWAFLVEHAGQDRHFHIPGHVHEEDGAVKVKISGPSLVAALTSLRAVHQNSGAAPGTAAIAQHLYQRIADTVDAVAQDPHGGGHPVTIIIDDRARAVDDGPPAVSDD